MIQTNKDQNSGDFHFPDRLTDQNHVTGQHFFTNGEEEKTLTIAPGEVESFQNVIKDQIDQIGIHADVKADTEIKVRLYDGK